MELLQGSSGWFALEAKEEEVRQWLREAECAVLGQACSPAGCMGRIVQIAPEDRPPGGPSFGLYSCGRCRVAAADAGGLKNHHIVVEGPTDTPNKSDYPHMSIWCGEPELALDGEKVDDRPPSDALEARSKKALWSSSHLGNIIPGARMSPF
ncbi:hypothetical protein PAPYR_9939 [Paratrimastix pyriformis]|uniref:PH domain-containing protein n=1 Tax=Paratrimastix pyriformis TaxID=342808 RepID=A0ABQ8UB69_9EUKA|nr:hypothetical protein PAPYR_9939 [Paratrimastix pyriformis]